MKTTTKRLERWARQQNPRMSDDEVRELAQRVAESLAARRAPKGDPAWEGCR